MISKMEKSRKPDTIRENYLFSRVYSKGKSCFGRYAAVYYLKDRRKGGNTRIGITVSKSRGKAVVRNRVKRRIRETLRLLYPYMKEGYLIVAVARQPAVTASYAELSGELAELLNRAALLDTCK